MKLMKPAPALLRSKTVRLGYVVLLRVGVGLLLLCTVPSARHAFVQGAQFLCKVPERRLTLRSIESVA
jgi:hypothetical protein